MAVFRPLPAYEGGIGPLPATDVDTSYLLARYGITKPTLFKRRDVLVKNDWVKPQKVGSRVYYSAQDVHLLDCLHYWSSHAFNLTEVENHLRQQEEAYKQADREEEENAFEPLPDEAYEVKSQNTTTDLVVRGLQTSAKDLQLLGEEFVEKFAQRVGDVVREAMPQDLLAGHDFLSKAADKGYQLTSKLLAEALGLKSQSLSGWTDRYEKYGFIIVRVSRGHYRVERPSQED
jgi:DNA-binding transcriptional MerR regulator